MTISETANANFDKITHTTRTAREIALTPHTLSADAKYARCADGALFIWSDRRDAWVQIDHEPNPSEMTYRERYLATTEWQARHLAKDLMEMNGPDEFITERDDLSISELERAA